jgi:hypothetical protein
MAIEHEPGCDRQHTARQRCNQNALFAEQGETPTEGSDELPSTGAISAVSDRPDFATEAAAVEEIVAIREEVLIPKAPPERDAPQLPPREAAGDRGGDYTMLVRAAVLFAVVTAVLVMLLRRGERDS